MTIKLDLHRAQLKVFHDQAQVKALCSGRGFGKSVLLLTTAIYKCLSYEGTISLRSPQVALIAMPTLKMVRQIHWEPLLNLLDNSPLVKKVYRSDFRIKWKAKNKPDLILRGVDNAEKLRGLNVMWAGLDEFQDFDPYVWTEILFPALGRNKNYSALVIGTPKGKNSYFHQFCLQAEATSNWSYHHFKTADNPFFPREVLKEAKLILPDRTYKQEFEASWETPPGQIFDCLLDDHLVNGAPTSNQIKHIYLGVDWGSQNPALVVVALTTSYEFYIIDYWWNQQGQSVPLDDLMKEAATLCNRYSIRKTFAPDDNPSNIISFQRYGKKHKVSGLANTEEVKRNKPGIMPGNAILNSLFHQNRLYLNKQLTELIEDFQSYHRITDPLTGAIVDKEAQNQRQHSVSAARYAIASLETRNNFIAKAAA